MAPPRLHGCIDVVFLQQSHLTEPQKPPYVDWLVRQYNVADVLVICRDQQHPAIRHQEN